MSDYFYLDESLLKQVEDSCAEGVQDMKVLNVRVKLLFDEIDRLRLMLAREQKINGDKLTAKGKKRREKSQRLRSYSGVSE